MQNYELMVIFTPVLSEEEFKSAQNKFTTLVTENGGKIVHTNAWGLKSLAYPIQKKTTGFYHLTEFKAPGELINKLEVEYKRDERIMRFLTVSLDKHAKAYNEKKRSGAFNKKAETKTEEGAN